MINQCAPTQSSCFDRTGRPSVAKVLLGRRFSRKCSSRRRFSRRCSRRRFLSISRMIFLPFSRRCSSGSLECDSCGRLSFARISPRRNSFTYMKRGPVGPISKNAGRLFPGWFSDALFQNRLGNCNTHIPAFGILTAKGSGVTANRIETSELNRGNRTKPPDR